MTWILSWMIWIMSQCYMFNKMVLNRHFFLFRKTNLGWQKFGSMFCSIGFANLLNYTGLRFNSQQNTVTIVAFFPACTEKITDARGRQYCYLLDRRDTKGIAATTCANLGYSLLTLTSQDETNALIGSNPTNTYQCLDNL